MEYSLKYQGAGVGEYAGAAASPRAEGFKFCWHWIWMVWIWAKFTETPRQKCMESHNHDCIFAWARSDLTKASKKSGNKGPRMAGIRNKRTWVLSANIKQMFGEEITSLTAPVLETQGETSSTGFQWWPAYSLGKLILQRDPESTPSGKILAHNRLLLFYIHSWPMKQCCGPQKYVELSMAAASTCGVCFASVWNNSAYPVPPISKAWWLGCLSWKFSI